ncbi:MAG TPA: HEPN domain-containing protein [Sedimentisphaerales bacterium]|nr:HEPN domain-containing protein [Sedimentisphaerales bacterium]
MNDLSQKELTRAKKALLAAKTLLENQLYQDCVSRSYYAVLHAAKAALTTVGVEPESHHAVRRMFGLHLVKSGKIEKEFAAILTAEQEDREIGDYDIYIEIEQDRARKSVLDAEKFVERIEKYLRA